MTIDFSFRISSAQCVSQFIIAEAVGMYAGGKFLHRNSEIELSKVARYRVEPADHNQWNICGSLLTKDVNRVLLAHYLLMVGFFKANFSVEYFGDYANWLPQHGRLISEKSPALHSPPPIKLPRLFREHLDSQAGNVPMSIAALEDLHNSLMRTDTINELPKSAVVRFASENQMLVTFPGDVSVEFIVANQRIESHGICGFTLGGITAENGLRDECPKEVRTWGEAWLAHDESQASLLAGLLTLPGEVGVVTDRLYRYRIDEPETIAMRDSSQFGKGKSKVYDRGQWIRYAGKYFEMRSKSMVDACLNQAEHLSETKAHFSELDRLRKRWKLFALPSGSGSLFSIEEIRNRCGTTVHAKVADVDKSRMEAYEYSDYGRQAWNVSGVCYTESTPIKVMNSGMNGRVFELLTGHPEPQFLPQNIPRLFCFDADDQRVWGHDTTGRYFVEKEPNIVFGS